MWRLLLATFCVLLGCAGLVAACDPPPVQYWLDSSAYSFYECYKEEYQNLLVTISDLERTRKSLPEKSSARTQADSLLRSLQDICDTSRLSLGILAHNLSFKLKDPELRAYSEELFKQLKKDSSSQIYEMYLGSLRMMKVRDEGVKGAVVSGFKTLFGGKSAYGKAREGYHRISKAVNDDTLSVPLRMLRASAAVESADKLKELLDSARIDLEWLVAHYDLLVPEERFLTLLSWGKLYYRLDSEQPSDSALAGMNLWMDRAYYYSRSDSCLFQYYGGEAELWKQKDSLHAVERTKD